MLREPEPVLVVALYPGERRALLELLQHLEPDAWQRPTGGGTWTVKDVAAHLVADDLGRLSAQRDEHRERQPAELTLKEWIDRRNDDWVRATRRLSPRVIQSLLGWSGGETQAMFESLDPMAMGRPVSWAGPDPAPVWLDLARELTERWHHQQQIREATGRPLLDDDELLRATLATFAWSLPVAFRDVAAPQGTSVH